jgi:tRNA(fMet)-specific endonuclease VapC
MTAYMIDTNVCIDAIRRSNRAVIEKLQLHERETNISSITLAELRFGAEKSDRRSANLEELRRFLVQVSVLSFDAAASVEFGEIKATLSGSGRVIGPYDLLIAAHARSLGMTVVTNNRREFDRVPGLRVENWLA